MKLPRKLYVVVGGGGGVVVGGKQFHIVLMEAANAHIQHCNASENPHYDPPLE